VSWRFAVARHAAIRAAAAARISASAIAGAVVSMSSAAVRSVVMRIVFAWKKAQRLDASIFCWIVTVWAAFPSVSEIARNRARTEIRRAIFLFPTS
jgi:hypothetical protein